MARQESVQLLELSDIYIIYFSKAPGNAMSNSVWLLLVIDYWCVCVQSIYTHGDCSMTNCTCGIRQYLNWNHWCLKSHLSRSLYVRLHCRLLKLKDTPWGWASLAQEDLMKRYWIWQSTWWISSLQQKGQHPDFGILMIVVQTVSNVIR